MVQRLARAIKKDGYFVLTYVQVDAQIGVQGIDIRADAIDIAELVDDGIFHGQAGILRMGEETPARHGIDAEGLVGAEQLAPIDFLHLII